MTPSVSVVIPAYNAGRFLKEALDSVLRQSTQALEVLVVDDGSTDDTGSLAASVRGVRCIHQANAGVSAARNRGIEEARGAVIALLDADDAWEVDKLAIQLQGLGADTFACSARTETDEQMTALRVVRRAYLGPLLEGLLFHGNIVGTPSSVMVPRNRLLETGGFDPDLSMCADWDMWIRLATRLSSRYSDVPLVRYRIHGNNMSTNLKTYEADSDRMFQKAFALDLPPNLMARKDEALSRMSEVLAGSYWNQGAFRDAGRCALKSIRRRPSRLAALSVSVPFRMLKRTLARSR